MTISLWRYSHLALAVSSFLLLTLLSVTGIILAFEPIIQKSKPYRSEVFNQIDLAQSLPVLRKAYPDISELSVDANQFVKIKASGPDGKNFAAYVDPLTGRLLGRPEKTSIFFEWVRSLHRSLFLHETGRAIIGVTAFLLILITTSGLVLIIKRQRGIKRFFKRIVRDNFAQYYHAVLGRLSLLPIFIIAISGTYLSLARFNILDLKKAALKVDLSTIRSAPEIKPDAFGIFKQIRMLEIVSIEFPFSEDAEDYYILKLTDREIAVNQITGDVLSEIKYPKAAVLSSFSLNVHTGRTNIVWAIVLAVSAASILFFIYSGFAMTFKRLTHRVSNKFKADECRFIILVGSENCSTLRFAKVIHQQLLKQNQRSFITELNNYAVFPKAEHLIVISATYGLGEAPANGTDFSRLLEKYPQTQTILYSVLGFGSHNYPDFCRFAFQTDRLLSDQIWAKPLIDLYTVNDRSLQEFGLWAEAWSKQSGTNITAYPGLHVVEKHRQHSLMVSSTKTSGAAEGIFLIRLKPKSRQKVASGDLLAIYPANDHQERLYSIGVVDDEIQLSVRLHEGGLGSGYLYKLTPGDRIRARIVRNVNFHFPARSPKVVMISNGTGIAPFIGMISQNQHKIPCHLYCGFRESSAMKDYQHLLDTCRTNGKLLHLHTAFSREGKKQYVSDLITRDIDFVISVLKDNGAIMICGSLAMQKNILAILAGSCEAITGRSISFYRSHNQILTDCY